MKRILFIMCILVGINTYGQKKKSTQKYTKSYTTAEALAYVDDYFSFLWGWFVLWKSRG